MTDLLDCIRIALAEGATPEQKQAGATACCAVYAALSPPPGVPVSVPHAPQTRPHIDQMLDLAIAKLRSMLPPDAAAQITSVSLRFPFLEPGAAE
ncbi:MAG: hypothetical protein H6708_27715 [Kofleriaceae bacterium]|nr:hypothetical protein [Myxococcales bacterium]MCB9564196.1 hypothetical protein [Kofleriaceae bacterium]